MGNPKLLEAVELLAEGTCSTEYLDELKSLSQTMQVAQQVRPRADQPVAFLSILEHFGDEVLGRDPQRVTSEELR